MKDAALGCLLLLTALSTVDGSWAVSCDRQLLPELSFRLSGRSLDWPNDNSRKMYESTGRYSPRSVIATRAQIHRDRVFLALPRLKPGVPLTLGVASLQGCEPAISPFPNWALQEEGNCEALQSVVGLVLDAQDVLWALDAGVVNGLEQPVRRCPPKVVAFDVKSSKILKAVELGKDLAGDESRLQYLVVDYAPDGELFLYVSDAASRAVIVYNVTTGRGQRVVLPTAVEQGCASRDELYLALVRGSRGASVLYLGYLGSERLFGIRADELRRGKGGIFQLEDPKNGKIVLLGTDNGSAIFFRHKGESDVYMWNTETSFRPDNLLLVQRGNECRLPTQVLPGYGRLMWVIESNFRDYVQNTVSCNGASVHLHPLVKSCED